MGMIQVTGNRRRQYYDINSVPIVEGCTVEVVKEQNANYIRKGAKGTVIATEVREYAILVKYSCNGDGEGGTKEMPEGDEFYKEYWTKPERLRVITNA